MDQRFEAVSDKMDTRFEAQRTLSEAQFKAMMALLGEFKAQSELVNLRVISSLSERLAVVEAKLAQRQ